MKILQISTFNINSLAGESSIDFTKSPLKECGLFAITGPTGAGKTTLLDAITLAIYGQVARGANVRDVMTHGTGECRAEVVFQSKTGTYKAKWSLHRSRFKPDGELQNPKCEIAEWPSGQVLASQRTKMNDVVAEVLSLSPDQFLKSVLLAQGEFTAFLKADAKKRAELLEAMTGGEIYRELSRKAFAKHRAEEEKEARLTLRMQAVSTLSAEDEKKKQDELQAAEADKEKLETERTKLNTEKLWHDTLAKLQASLKTAAERHSVALQNKEQAAAAFALWNAHLQVEDLEPDFDTWQRANKELKVLESELENLKNEIDTKKIEVQSTEQQRDQASHAAIEAMEVVTEQKPILNKANERFIQLGEWQKALTDGQQSHKSKLRKLSDAQAQLKKDQTLLEENQAKLTILAAWLREHAADGQLSNIIKEARADLQKLRAAEALNQSSQTVLAEIAGSLSLAEGTVAEAIGKKAQAEQEIRKLDAHEQQLTAALGQWRFFGERETQIAEAEIAQLTKTLDAIQKQIADKDFFIKNSQALEDGQPCLLCGSTVHAHSPHDLEQFKRDRAALQTQQLEASEIKKARETELKKLETLVGQLTDIPSAQSCPEEFSLKPTGEAAALLKGLRELPAARANLAAERANHLGAIERGEEEKVKAQKQRLAKQGDADRSQAEINTISSRFGSLARQHSQEYELGGEQALIDYLDKREKEFTASTHAKEMAELQVANGTKAISTAADAISGADAEIKSLDETIKRLTHQIETTTAEVGETFKAPHKSPQEYLDALEKEMALKAKAAEDIAALLQQHNTALTSKSSTETEKRRQREEKTGTLHQAAQRLLNALAGRSLEPSIEKAAQMLIDRDKRGTIGNQIKDIENEIKAAEARKNELHAELDQHSAADHSPEALESITGRLEQLGIELSGVIELAGAIKQQLKDDAEAKRSHAALIEERERQHQETLRWQALKELIGQADGSKFARFAQSISMAQLLGYANHHLGGLTDRYQLRSKDSNGELKLLVADNYLGGTLRDTASLSGGEGFLVSLGLALGLSAMASQNTRIDSLFIDEGFGTLDEESLETALSTLEQLHSNGKTIGVISHVAQLKERIGTQIVVMRTNRGYSKISVVG